MPRGPGVLLARAHAQSPACPTLAAYLGRSDAFDRAVTTWAVGYADQTERDHAALASPCPDRQGAVRAGV